MKILFEGMGAKHNGNLSHCTYFLTALIKVRGTLQKKYSTTKNCLQDDLLLCRIACDALNATRCDITPNSVRESNSSQNFSD